MNCEKVRPELIAYQFGVVHDTTRETIEQHLRQCPVCLQEFFAIKREIETAPSGPRPSAAARGRLRQAVARELGVETCTNPWRWWERPLAFGFASAAIVTAIFSVQSLSSSDGSMPRSIAAQVPGDAPHSP